MSSNVRAVDFSAAKAISLRNTLTHFERWMADPEVDEIAVNRPGEVECWCRGRWITHAAPTLTFELLQMLGTQVSAFSTQQFSETSPEMSAWLPDGQRIEMTMPPGCLDGHILVNIRLDRNRVYTFDELVAQGYFTDTSHQMSLSLSDTRRAELETHLTPGQLELWQLATASRWPEFVQAAIAHEQNLLVSGSTGAGKTALLRALVELLDPKTRIVTAEDSFEIRLPNHRNSQHLFYKKESQVGMTAKQALAAAMRKTPDRIFLAELRGDECYYFIQTVLNSGHEGSLSTIHANSPRDAFMRMAMLVSASPEGAAIPFEEVKRLLYRQVHVVMQLVFDPKFGRRVPSIYFDPHHALSLQD